MQKSIILVCAALAIPAPRLWAQAAQAGSAQDNQELKPQIKQDAKQMTEDLIQTITAKTVASVVGDTFVFVGGQLFNGKPVKGQPYSAEAVTETTQTLADGNRIVNHSSSTIYRDSEGRERREESIGKISAWTAQGEPAKVVFISDPVAKVSYTLHTADRTAERMPAAGNMPVMVNVRGGVATRAITGDPNSVTVGTAAEVDAAAAAANVAAGGRGGRGGRGGAESATKLEKLGSQMIENVMAEGTRTTQTIPAGQIGNERDINIVSERWYSQELQEVVMTKRSDPRSGETVYKLNNVIRSEPLPSMFEVPSDYTISDSAAMNKLRQEKLQIRKEEQ